VQKEAVANYARKALQAFREVETALADERTLAEREAFLKTAVDENWKVYTI
jgi:multidrug efflux system outer membrane protein